MQVVYGSAKEGPVSSPLDVTLVSFGFPPYVQYSTVDQRCLDKEFPQPSPCNTFAGQLALSRLGIHAPLYSTGSRLCQAQVEAESRR